MSRSRQNATPESRFWSWFAQNSADLLAVRTAREPVIEHLSDELNRVRDGLAFEFGPVGADGRREFIVSADGNTDRFPAVKRLIALAPDLPGWLPIAFRPPKKMDSHLLRYGDIEMSGDDIWFTHDFDGRKIDIELFIRGLDEDNLEETAAPAMILLDSTLGEFVVESRIGGIAWHPLPDDPEAEGLQPFREMSSVVGFPLRCPVSLFDALDDPDAEPPTPTEEPDPEARWTLAQAQRGDQVSILGFREGMPDDGPALDHELLLVVSFNEVLDNGLPGSEEERDFAQRYESWVAERLSARCQATKALYMTGDGVRASFFYCADPAAAIKVWEEELQPNIRSHQVAFYVRRDPDWQVYRGIRAQCDNNASGQFGEMGEAAEEFLAETMADVRETLERNERLWLPVQVFAFGVAQAVGEEEELPAQQVVTLAYVLFVRCLEVSPDDATAAIRWILEHGEGEAVGALMAEGSEAFGAWRAGEGGVERLGEILAQMEQSSEEDEDS